MNKEHKRYKVIGMMSGTSLDGIDLSLATYSKSYNKWSYEVIGCKTYLYNQNHVQLIKQMEDPNLTYLQFRQKEIQYSQIIVECIQNFIQELKQTIKREEIDALALHGHTIFHCPAQRLTVQVGNLQYMASKLKINVIGNFRQFDVHCGGQGAPLAPYGQELFSQAIYLNLGGVANIGYKGKGHDIVFCNMILNKYSQKIERKPYDNEGNLGKQGVVDSTYLQFLKTKFKNEDNHSLARQEAYQQLLQIQSSNQSKQILINRMRTFYEFIADSVVQCVEHKFTKQRINQEMVITVYCTGGGAYNKFLIQLFNQNKSNIKFILPDKQLIEFKQALIFGLLGVKYLENERNCEYGIGGELVKGSNALN